MCLLRNKKGKSIVLSGVFLPWIPEPQKEIIEKERKIFSFFFYMFEALVPRVAYSKRDNGCFSGLKRGNLFLGTPSMLWKITLPLTKFEERSCG